ncbi:reverse transcriptase domain-containing protein [Tanacetum coccineum]
MKSSTRASLNQLAFEAAEINRSMKPSLEKLNNVNVNAMEAVQDPNVVMAGMREKIQATQSKALKQENVIMENMHGLDQQMEKEEGERTAEFMDREVKSLKRSKIVLVQIRWDSKRGPEFTWERKDRMRLVKPLVLTYVPVAIYGNEKKCRGNEVDSDLESTASSKPVWEKTTEDDHDRASRNCAGVSKNGGNGGGGNGNGGKNGCTFKAFQSCNPKEYNGKGVRYAASSLVNKALTWWNTQVQSRGREAAMAMTWNDFKALMVEEFCPSNKMDKLAKSFWKHKWWELIMSALH